MVGIRLPKTRGRLRREAAGWLARLQSGRDPDIERKFRRWLDADTAHAAAFGRIQRSYEQAGLLRQSRASADEIGAVSARLPFLQPYGWAAAAAAALALVLLAGLYLNGGALGPAATEAVMLSTRVGEIRNVELADGSRITLDTATRLDVEIGRSGRSAHLRHGRVRFRVVRAGEPFVVETASATISTREGVLDVEQIGENGHVEVLAGAADVRASNRSDAASVTVAAGEDLAVTPGGTERKRAAAAAHDWTRGMLQFDATPLPDAVALANRYSERHIVLVGDLAALRVTGAFRAGDTAGLAKALAAAFSLTLEQNGDGDLVLSSSRSSRVQDKGGG